MTPAKHTMLPTRLAILTCNLWRTERWPARAPAWERFFSLWPVDLLCVQELEGATQAFLDRLLGQHARVKDSFAGWTSESNIYWSEAVFEEVGHGTEEIGHLEPDRRLFWARLRVRSNGQAILVATAHLSGRRNSHEAETGSSPRVAQLKAIADRLPRLVHSGEAVFFAGDMNEAWHTQQILRPAGLVGCFAALGLQSPPTFQCYPAVSAEPGEPAVTEAIDFILANRLARVVTATVPRFIFGGHALSDRWPVQAVYELS